MADARWGPGPARARGFAGGPAARSLSDGTKNEQGEERPRDARSGDPRRRSETPPARRDLVEERPREREVGACRVVAHEERIGDARRVVALGRERELALLERPGHVHLADEPHEGRASVAREVTLAVRVEGSSVETLPLAEHDRRHAGAALRARDDDAVDARLAHARGGVQQVGDLLRGDVLALPPEGVAEAVDEVVVAVGVAAQEVARPEPGVACRDRIPHELRLRRLAIGVAVVVDGRALAADAPEELARLAGLAGDAEAVRAAHQLATGEVEAGKPHVVFQQRMGFADGSDPPIGVVERDVALRRAVHLDDPRDAEALLEGDPDVRPEAGPGGDAQPVVAVAGRDRLAEEAATERAHDDEVRRPVAADVVEEGVRREAPARGERPADAEGGS